MEGSAFDLPMALGLAGCQGSFFGKVLDTLRLSWRTLARCRRARERGIKHVVVLEADARKAAVVDWA
jgi:hypothetical protein